MVLNRRDFIMLTAGTLVLSTSRLRAKRREVVVSLHGDKKNVLYSQTFPFEFGHNQFDVEFAPEETCSVVGSTISGPGIATGQTFSPIYLVGQSDTLRLRWDLEVKL